MTGEGPDHAPPVDSARVVVVGGSGAMGQWFAKYFTGRGAAVTLAARDRAKLDRVARALGVRGVEIEALEETVAGADVVVVSVPINATLAVATRCARAMRAGAELIEVASVKGSIPDRLADLHDETGVRPLSLHPMFGPGAASLAGHTVVVVPTSGTRELALHERAWRDRLAEEGARVVVAPAGEHDRQVALTLDLAHLTSIAFGAALRRSGQALERVTEFTGTTFALHKALAMSVLSESPEAYAQIQLENPAFAAVARDLHAWLGEYLHCLETRDYESFARLFADARDYLADDPGFGSAYETFYALVETLHAARDPAAEDRGTRGTQ